MQPGLQTSPSWDVPQRDAEDNHGPYDDFLPQLGVSCQKQTGQGNLDIHA